MQGRYYNNDLTIKTLRLVHTALLTGLVLFAAVTFYLVYSRSVLPSLTKEQEKIFQVIAVLLAAAGFFTGATLLRKQIATLREGMLGAKEKFRQYRRTILISWVCIEMPALFAIACFLLSGNYALLTLALFVTVLFATLSPSRIKIAFQLNISEEEANEL